MGTIVEILNSGEAYLVELWGDWIQVTAQNQAIPVNSTDPLALQATLGVETLTAQQLIPASDLTDIRSRLFYLSQQLSDEQLEKVENFARSQYSNPEFTRNIARFPRN
ncbi:MAG: hypothetical protein ACO331_02740 [Prochlorothrix sp.]